MKIFSVANNYPSSFSLPASRNKAGSEAFIEESETLIEEREKAAPKEKAAPVVYAVPDTALLKDNRPFFIPDFAQPCTYQASLVLRIGRLGRSIAPRFAHRYIDAVTVGIAFTADNLWREAVEKGLPWDVSKGFDNAAVVGRFLTLDTASDAPLQQAVKQRFVVMDRAQESEAEIVTQDSACLVDWSTQATRRPGDHRPLTPRFSPAELVAYLSRYYLLRQGDLIFMGFPCAPQTACIDHHLTAQLGDTQLLSFNIK